MHEESNNSTKPQLQKVVNPLHLSSSSPNLIETMKKAEDNDRSMPSRLVILYRHPENRTELLHSLRTNAVVRGKQRSNRLVIWSRTIW